MQIRRGTDIILQVPRGDSTSGTVTQAIMAVSKATVSFVLPQHVELLIGDSIVLHGETFYLNKLPAIREASSMEWHYTCNFESKFYSLRGIQFLGPDAINELVQPEFLYMGTAEAYIDLLLMNIARRESGWSKGNVIETEAKPMSFQGDNCLAVLSKLAQEFNTEFWIINKVIHLNKQGSTVPLTFQYGRNKGLRGIERNTKDEQELITRLYVTGGSRNIPGDYRNYSNKLLIPAVYGTHYLDNNVDKYDVKEGSQPFDDVYPHRVGTVTSVGADEFTFKDADIDFDVNQHLIPGVSVKLTFNSGQLAGYTFELPKAGGFDNATRTFKLLPNTEDKAVVDAGGNLMAFTLPNATMRPAVGDKYVLTDIYMPQSYIDAAENELLIRAQEHLAEVSNPNLQYTVTPDPLFFKREAIVLNLGDSVTIYDEELGINRPIRITALERDIRHPYRYTTIKLQDIVEVPSLAQRATQIKEIQKAITHNRLGDPYRARMNWRTAKELNTMIFDSDGGFFTELIRPIVVETMGITVGAKSGQYLLNGVIFSPNDGGTAARFAWTAGELVHYEIEAEPRTWSIDSGLMIALQDPVAYYLYAKCAVEGTAGTILVTTEKIKVLDDPAYYHFPVGVLHSVIDNVRAISLTYGFTNINGRFIRTGVIIGRDGGLVIDLDESFVKGRIVFGNNGTSTIVDGNLVTSSTILLGTGTGVKVGMNGQGEAEDGTDVRIWAGADFDSRSTAAFRVLQNGKMFASDAEIAGHINAKSGKVGDLYLVEGNLYNQDGEGNIVLKHTFPGGGRSEARIGTNAFFDESEDLAADLRSPARFLNTRENPSGINRGVTATATGALHNNAISCYGALELGGPTVYYHSVIQNDSGMVFITGTSYTATNMIALIMYQTNSNGTINLPPNPQKGQVMKIRKYNNITLTVQGNGKLVRNDSNAIISSFAANHFTELVFDGINWVRNI